MKLKTFEKPIVFVGETGLEMPVRQGVTWLKIFTDIRPNAYVGKVIALCDYDLTLTNGENTKIISYSEIKEVFYSDILE